MQHLITTKTVQNNNKIAYQSKADHPRMRALSYACSLPVTWQRWRTHHSICHSQ